MLNRRAFLTRTGVAGTAAAALLAGCGGGSGLTGGNGGTGSTGFSSAVVRKAFQDLRTHEQQHVTLLVGALGSAARPEPTFDLTQPVWNPPDLATFYELALALENTGTGAYVAAARYLTPAPDTLVIAASIALVEGRHAGFLNSLTGRVLLTDPTPGQSDRNDPTGRTYATLPNGLNRSQEVPQSVDTVLARAQPFLVNANLNGGPPLTYSTTTSAENVVAVVNFALALEYLERNWYDRNVPRFFS